MSADQLRDDSDRLRGRQGQTRADLGQAVKRQIGGDGWPVDPSGGPF